MLTELRGGQKLLTQCDHNGMTPLMYAARLGRKDAVEALLMCAGARRALQIKDL